MVETGATFADACTEFLRYVKRRPQTQAIDDRRL
jgi:hypothetical protein